jgi:hypothetical protein
MSYMIAAPEMMTSAATDWATIGSDLSAAHQMAATPTVGLVPAAADEVSASIAHVFSQHAAGYQALAGQAAAFHAQFVHNLTASAASYTSADAASATTLLGDLLASIQAAITSLISNNPILNQINQVLNLIAIQVIESPLGMHLGAFVGTVFNLLINTIFGLLFPRGFPWVTLE